MTSLALADWGPWEENEALHNRTPRPAPLRWLKSHECRWPLVDAPHVTGGYLFCAAVTRPERTYCDEHHGVAKSGRS